MFALIARPFFCITPHCKDSVQTTPRMPPARLGRRRLARWPYGLTRGRLSLLLAWSLLRTILPWNTAYSCRPSEIVTRNGNATALNND